MQVEEWYQALVSALSDLGLPVIKGWPAWDRPDVARPTLALLWSNATPRRARIGNRPQWQLAFDLFLVANYEDELLALLGSLLDWLEGHLYLTLDEARAALALTRLERVVPPATVVAARYSAQATLTLEVTED